MPDYRDPFGPECANSWDPLCGIDYPGPGVPIPPPAPAPSPAPAPAPSPKSGTAKASGSSIFDMFDFFGGLF